ncbi:MAG TPA: bifunctional DNA-formamidopyrimidine glycosylase/DNA-(apurinic or apyrimidinic site) lyase [Acidimicrobiales bacterium]|jgi:formamidopyrimidine-DNA glycosylase|nr:bifunctional DNA-formamidopyrimidine glycosylase/DNA-(apurinic or apyrimidinic site) lyase [Acidimicrobiales bacterium]
MPELPEVETIRRGLDREVVGKRVKTAQVSGTRTVRRQTKKQFIARLEGAKITGVDRRGKYLVLKLDTGELLVIHLGMSGQLLRAQARDQAPKHTHVVLTFTQGGQLRFVDPRTFGELFVTAPDELTTEVPELASLGMDPVDVPIPWVKFREMLLSRTTKLKPLLMDQSFVAGLGNIYSDEILWEAGLRHDRTPQSLSTMEIRRLYRAIVEVLHEAVKHRGSTLGDQQYVDLHGRPGEFQGLHQAYDREGQACRRCRTTIVREKLGSRSTFYCPNCQI